MDFAFGPPLLGFWLTLAPVTPPGPELPNLCKCGALLLLLFPADPVFALLATNEV